MKNIIISSKDVCHCLGHEIHATRCVIIDMLLQKYIDEDDIIVVKNDERKFLYNLLFKRVITIHEFSLIDNIQEYNVIDLFLISENPGNIRTHCIPNFEYSKNYYTEEFKNNLLKLNFFGDVEVNENFVLVHHRYNCDISILRKIYYKIRELYGDVKIIIFNYNIQNLGDVLNSDSSISNIFLIDNLNLYSTYLHKKECILFISEWSGGGQLAQYCFGGKIRYYCNNYSESDLPGHVSNFKKLVEASTTTDYLDCYDFKNPLDSDMKLFKNIDELLCDL